MFRRLKWLWIIGFWVIMMVLLLEVGLRLLTPSLPSQLRAVARTVITGQPYEEAWSPAWIENPEYTYILRPNIDNELQYGSPSVSFQLSTIELWEGGGVGFRTRPVDYFVDAVVVGDSFGFCFTQRADCWVTQLEQQTGMGLVNLSLPVTGSTSHGRILRDFGQAYTPPLVIWQFFGNDFNDDYGLLFADDRTDTQGEQEVDTSIGGWFRENSVTVAIFDHILNQNRDDIFAETAFATVGDATLGFGQAYEQQALAMSLENNQQGYESTRGILIESRDLIDSWDGHLVILIIPTREEVYAHLSRDLLGDNAIDTLSSARFAMLDLCTELDLICYDPLGDLQARAEQGDVLYYADDMHLNPLGNAVLAEKFAEWLEDNNIWTSDS